MLGIPLFGLVLRLLGHRAEKQTDERQVRRELLAHQRRQLIHARIPSVDTVRESFGPRFAELQQLLTNHHVASEEHNYAYYPELTRTVLYQLHKASNEEQLMHLLEQEQGLWFGWNSIGKEQLATLVRAVREWQVAAGL